MIDENNIRGLIRNYIEYEKFDFIETKFSRWKNTYTLKIYIDKDGGVTIDDCVYLTRGISDMIVKENIFRSYDYRLEVSSPGVDRPLKTIKDFKKNLNRLIELEYNVGDKKEKVRGVIESVQDETIEIKTDELSKKTLNIKNVILGKIKLQW